MALAKWFKARVECNGGRMKKTTIVALAHASCMAVEVRDLWGRDRRCRYEKRITRPPLHLSEIYRGLMNPGGSR